MSQQSRAGSPRRTVLIAHPSADVYGADLQLLESITGLVDAGWRVVVAVPGDGPLVSRLTERGAEVGFVSFPVLRRANTSAAGFARMIADAGVGLPKLVRVIRRFAPDVVYVNTVTLPWWLAASRLTGTPTVGHLHEAEKGDRALVLKGLLSPLLLAHRVIVISRSTLEAAAEVLPAIQAKARLVYNGVPQPPEEPEPAVRGERTRLVYVGRLSPRKAPHLVLESAGRLVAQGYDVAVEVVGSAFEGYEWYVAELEERAARPDLQGRVTFTGYASPVWPVLAAADIAVMPSLREPFGNAVVEAQLAMRPVVATRALGHTESITDQVSGLLTEPEDVEAMAAAIASLIDDPALADRLAREGRRAAIERFSVDRYRREIADVVAEVSSLRQ